MEENRVCLRQLNLKPLPLVCKKLCGGSAANAPDQFLKAIYNQGLFWQNHGFAHC